ncbi:MAG: putative Ig domain-containing protein, partial [Halanaerobiales bacterium]
MKIKKEPGIQRRTKKTISYIYICLLIISFCLSYPVDASDGPLLKLSFDGDLQDSSGNNFDGIWDGNGSFAPGKSGQAAVFTPDNGNTVVINHDAELGGMEQITITVWAKKNNPSSTGVLIRKHMHYSLSVGDNSVNSYVGSSSNELGRANVFDASLVNDTNWHYYVLTYDGSMVRLYIDNQQVAEKPLTGDVLNDGYDIKIGPFDGLIDELSIYTENIDVQPPTIPQGLSGSVFSHSEIRLSWSESSDNIGVEGYRIYRNDQLIFETAETFYNDMGLDEKNDYEYKVTAYDENNNESLPSEAISLRTYAQNNNAPTISSMNTIQINEGDALSYIIPASDIDGDPIFFSCKNLPAGSTLDAETGEFSWRPVYSQAGTYEIPITVSDLRLETTDNLNVVVNDTPSDSKIRIEPGDLVEVGEEVYFDAMQYYDHGDDAEYRWNFGDGYAMEPGTPAYNFRDSGTACTHYFMKPGSYEVVLTIVKDDEILATDSVFVAVKGEEPVAGFEVWHAPFRSRVSQRVYIQIPQNINVHRVTASLKGEKGFDHKYLDVTNPAAEESFRLVNKDLIADKYVLEVKLFDSKGDCISLIREKYNKTIDGAPKIGVNEDNAYMIDGKDLFFPITPFMMNKGNEIWPKMYINTFHTEGWYESHNADTWNDYVKTAYDKGLYAIGPERWDGKVSRLQERYARNSNVDKIEEYVLKSKDLPGMFGWCWDDEPTLGGTTGYIPPQVHAAWSYRTHMHDDYHHPVVLQMYGFGYLPYYNPLSPDRISGYDFLSSAQQFGGKKAFVADGTGSDIYPFFAASHVAFDSSERGLYDLWVEALQNQVKLNYDMIPVTLFVGTQCIMAPEKLNDLSKWQAGPTPEFVRMETWLGVINGAKGINYFHAFSPTPADNMSVLGEFREVVEDLAPVILGPVPERTVTDSANERGNRVDTMIRETNEDIYIFASRLSEPESQWDEVFEPETIEVEFQVSDLTNTSFAYEELEKYRWTYDCFDVTESTNKFSGVLSQVPLRPDTVCITVVKSIDPDKPLILIDRMTGKEYDYPTHSMGNLINLYDDGTGNLESDKFGVSGTINYETGDFEINFPNPIPAGERYVRVGYSKENRAARIIDINNDGTFIDTFERNDVRIYRITKQAEPYIMQQPLSKTITEGSDIELKVLAGGTPELRYQWYFNGDIIENASSYTLDITNVQVDDGGEYFVEIKNDLGSVISDTVTLTVTDPLPQVLEFNCITEFYSNYLSWKNPANQAGNWDSIIIVRKEGSEPTGPDDGEIIYDGIGCSLIDKNLSDGDYYYAAYTYMDFTTNTLYSEPIHRSVSIPEMFNKDYLLVKSYQDQINENPMIIGQNTEGDSYSLWNTSSINIGKGPGGNNTGLWIYSDIVGTNPGQAPTDSKIVSARLVFNVEDSNLIDSETNEGNSINHPHSINIYRITDPQGLGTPHYADESGMRV